MVRQSKLARGLLSSGKHSYHTVITKLTHQSIQPLCQNQDFEGNNYSLLIGIEYKYCGLHGLCSCLLEMKQDKRNIDLSVNTAVYSTPCAGAEHW